MSNDTLPTRLRNAAHERTVTDPRAAALLLEAADAYDKIVRLWSRQTAQVRILEDELALALAALEQAQQAALEWEQRAREAEGRKPANSESGYPQGA